MTTLHTLASGSSGNALVISCGSTHLLVDAGISCRRITTSLRSLGLELADLTAILVTHTHTDHISGLQTLVKHSAVPLYGTARTLSGLRYRLAGIEDRLCPLIPGDLCELGNCTVTAIPTAHDAPGACGYRFDTAEGSIGVLTDTGFVTEEAAELLPGVDLAVLESNHDIDTLRGGSYPYFLKQRILGSEGHLSNEDAARFAVTLADNGAGEIILAHLSKENNTPALALEAVSAALAHAGLDPALSVAPRDTLSGPHILGRTACKK